MSALASLLKRQPPSTPPSTTTTPTAPPQLHRSFSAFSATPSPSLTTPLTAPPQNPRIPVPLPSTSFASSSSSSSIDSHNILDSASSASTSTAAFRESHKLVKSLDVHGSKLINQYTVIREIGRGVHGKVKMAVDGEDGSLWAIKILDKRAKKRFQNRFAFSHQQRPPPPNNTNPSNDATPSSPPTVFDAINHAQLQKVKREIAILKKINHPNVVGLREVIDDPEAEKMYLVLEYMAGGELEWRNMDYDPAKPILTLFDARRILRDVISGLEYLHHNGIIHRDIKPANLLTTSTTTDDTHRCVKISDFGVSVFLDRADPEAARRELGRTAGSPAFFAPEVCAVVEEDDEGDTEGSSSLSGSVGEHGTVGSMGTTSTAVTGGGDEVSFGAARWEAGASLTGRSLGVGRWGNSEGTTLTAGGSSSADGGHDVSDARKRNEEEEEDEPSEESEELVRKVDQNGSMMAAAAGGGGSREAGKSAKASLITQGLSSPNSGKEGDAQIPVIVEDTANPIRGFSINDLDLDFSGGMSGMVGGEEDGTPKASWMGGGSASFGVERSVFGSMQGSEDRVESSTTPFAGSLIRDGETGPKLRRVQRHGNGVTVGSPVSGMERYRQKYATATSKEDETAAAILEMGAAMDVWALGVTLYCLVFGRVPFV
ncbi:hypothetical protein HDU98_011943, partial [Podochytrium sp. JEL0797]